MVYIGRLKVRDMYYGAKPELFRLAEGLRKNSTEADGDIHLIKENVEYYDNRTGELERFGIKVIRFKNEEITNNLEQVISRIKIIITELSSPSLPGEGDRRG